MGPNETSEINGRAACYVAYYAPGNQLFLVPDNGDGTQATNIVLTGNNTISNSQCTVSAQGSNVQTSGNTLTVSLPITFKPAFVGPKAVWMAAQTLVGQTSPWQALGAWNVPGKLTEPSWAGNTRTSTKATTWTGRRWGHGPLNKGDQKVIVALGRFAIILKGPNAIAP